MTPQTSGADEDVVRAFLRQKAEALMTPRQREVFGLRYGLDQARVPTISAIARYLEIAEGAVYEHLRAAESSYLHDGVNDLRRYFLLALALGVKDLWRAERVAMQLLRRNGTDGTPEQIVTALANYGTWEALRRDCLALLAGEFTGNDALRATTAPPQGSEAQHAAD